MYRLKVRHFTRIASLERTLTCIFYHPDAASAIDRRDKRRAVTGLEVVEERERDASRQRRRDERKVLALPTADTALEARGNERQERTKT